MAYRSWSAPVIIWTSEIPELEASVLSEKFLLLTLIDGSLSSFDLV